jgi:N-acetylglutamate synthase
MSDPKLQRNNDESLAEECRENWIRAFQWLAELSPNGATESRNGVTVVRTGLPLPDFNTLFAFDPPNSLDFVDEMIERFFGKENVPWEIVTTSENSARLGQLAVQKNLFKTEQSPAMILDLLPEWTPIPPKVLSIREVKSADDVFTFLKTSDAGFGAPPGTLSALKAGITTNEAVSNRGVAYLGYVRGKPVATSLRFTTSDIAGIYSVSVLPEFRRRGFGEAMTWRAAVDGLEEGCTRSCLQATAMGFPVYEKMGYRVVEKYQIWWA